MQGKGSADTLSELSMASTAAPSSCSSGPSLGSSGITLKSNTDHKLARVVLQLRALKVHQQESVGTSGMQASKDKICSAVQQMKAMAQKPQLASGNSESQTPAFELYVQPPCFA